jgi:hypothetical protein
MLNLTRPRYLMPVHGDHKRIRLHAEMGEALGIAAENVFRGDEFVYRRLRRRPMTLPVVVVPAEGVSVAPSWGHFPSNWYPNWYPLRDFLTVSVRGLAAILGPTRQDAGSARNHPRAASPILRRLLDGRVPQAQ